MSEVIVDPAYYAAGHVKHVVETAAFRMFALADILSPESDDRAARLIALIPSAEQIRAEMRGRQTSDAETCACDLATDAIRQRLPRILHSPHGVENARVVVQLPHHASGVERALVQMMRDVVAGYKGW